MSGRYRAYRVDGLDLNVVEASGGNFTVFFPHYWGGLSRACRSTIEVLSKTKCPFASDSLGWVSRVVTHKTTADRCWRAM
jgi:hypothetical protein